MSTEPADSVHRAVLVLPRLRVQNANAISSPMTWGFPAITAFTGLMTALERRLGSGAGISFFGVGVICHGFEAQVTSGGYTRAFHLTRNPVLADGSTAGIVEEGRIHLDVTLVFDVEVGDMHRGESERAILAERVAEEVDGMRLAGGSVMPSHPHARRQLVRPMLELVADDGDEAQKKQFRQLARRCLPGFALVSRDDLLQRRAEELKAVDQRATPFEAWLDLSRLNLRAEQPGTQSSETPAVEWLSDPRPGWTVPIPVGYLALSGLNEPGVVAGARDATTPFRFVETVWSIGQWISPLRLTYLKDLFWFPHHDDAHPAEHGLYRCRNDYTPARSAREAEYVND